MGSWMSHHSAALQQLYVLHCYTTANLAAARQLAALVHSRWTEYPSWASRCWVRRGGRPSRLCGSSVRRSPHRSLRHRGLYSASLRSRCCAEPQRQGGHLDPQNPDRCRHPGDSQHPARSHGRSSGTPRMHVIMAIAKGAEGKPRLGHQAGVLPRGHPAH
eukprot:s3417_g7.t1